MKQGMYEFTFARQIAAWAGLVFGIRINSIDSSFKTLILPIEGEYTRKRIDPDVGIRLAVPRTGRSLLGIRAEEHVPHSGPAHERVLHEATANE